ncbi:MAG: hypothetical protein LUQ16_05325 [Methanomassiliicoccales archaeon]|nr:hypothetical protein [Methanomassiliicoccales archaeon]
MAYWNSKIETMPIGELKALQLKNLKALVRRLLLTNPELGNEFQIVIDRKGTLDDVLVRVELKPEAFTDNFNQLNALKEKIEGKLKNLLNAGVEIELVEPGSFPRFEGKAKRVVDRRVY